MVYTHLLNDLIVADTITKAYSAGTLVFNATFSWCTENQEQWDAFNQYVKRLSTNDPLYKKGEPYDRVYDYVDWYMQFKDCEANVVEGSDYYGQYKEVMKEQEFVPYSIHKYDLDNDILYAQVLIPRIDLCKLLYDYRLIFTECGVWQCTVNYNNDIRTAKVIPGGWACKQDNIFSFRFTSDRDSIGYDDLQYVTLEVDVK